jgi:hypothetical protein
MWMEACYHFGNGFGTNDSEKTSLKITKASDPSIRWVV